MTSRLVQAGRQWSTMKCSISYRKKRGIALVVVLAAMTIVVGVLLPLIPPALRARRQVEIEEVALQNEFLKSAVIQRLAETSPASMGSDDDISMLSGQVRFGPHDALQGEWLVRRKDQSQGEQSASDSSKLEVMVRLEFKETSESGVSPWMIPKSESVFPFPIENKNNSQQ
jgi:type II secretory pathway pseudopilin PulG